jgi:hypothetical protein
MPHIVIRNLSSVRSIHPDEMQAPVGGSLPPRLRRCVILESVFLCCFRRPRPWPPRVGELLTGIVQPLGP